MRAYRSLFGALVGLAGLVLLAGSGGSGFSRTLTATLDAQSSVSTVPTVRVHTDRTAMWMGDRITYIIEIVCPRGMDVLDDDLSKEKLVLDGLEVVGADATRAEGSDELTTRRFHYVLTSYRSDRTSRRIGPLTVRYFMTRPGQRLEDTPPAGSVQVPPTVVAFRSMMPEEQESPTIRDFRRFEPRARFFTLAQPVGLGLVILSIAPALIWGTALVTRKRVRTSQRSGRQTRREARASLEAVRAMSIDSEDGRRQAFDRIDALVRTHLLDVGGIAGPSLTPSEVAPALAARSSRLDPEAVVAVLALCERARYGPPAALPSREACREAIAQTETLLKSRW